MTRLVRGLALAALATVGAVAAVAAVAGCSRKSAPPPAPLSVAAAADLAASFREVGAAFEEATGQPVVFSFGATGLLERQIAEGAPFDAFAAANVTFADQAVASGACVGDSKAIYAIGHLVLYTGGDAGPRARSLADLASPEVKKIALANPDHAPYGRAAKQAMERAGVWAGVQSKVVFGENVQQTLQFAQSGNADVALVALSLVREAPGQYAEIPAELYDRLDQAIVACSRGKAGVDAGRRFATYVQSAAGRAILERFGFSTPPR